MRLFIATTFPGPVVQILNDRIASVRSRLPAASWVRPESQHMTFAFLGEQSESVIEQIDAAVAPRVKEVPAFEAFLRGCGFFPNARHARVGWVGAAPESRFWLIATAVREGVRALGIELDAGEFRPHLTLMRIRDRWPPASIDTFRRTLGDFESDPFLVEAVTLYSSRLNPNGAVHSPVRHFALG